MKRVNRINEALTSRLFSEVVPMMTESARTFITSVNVNVTECRRGRANWRGRVLRVPSWAFKGSVNFCGKGETRGGLGFAAYYLAHELAHIKCEMGGHGPRFMAAFKSFCPPDLQWYETLYKPRNAAAAGIGRKT